MDIAQRLERLERQNAWFKRIGFLTLLFIGSTFLMAQSPSLLPEIKAQKFSLYDSQGKNRGMFFTREGQAILILADQDGEPRLMMAVGRDGTPAFGLSDKADKVRVELSTSKGNPRLAFYSKDAGERMLLNVGSDGLPRIGLFDANKSARVVVGAAGQSWTVGVFDAKGNVIGGIGEK